MPMQLEQMRASAGTEPEALRSIERVYRDWDAALHAKDVEAAVVLYAEDAVLESPLVRHLADARCGVIRGRDHLRDFIRVVLARTPESRRHYRTGFFTDGRRLIWEYPRETPDGDQMDFVESMDVENGLIRRHRVYWGWYGVRVIEEDRYRR
jgi:hypothetical protein